MNAGHDLPHALRASYNTVFGPGTLQLFAEGLIFAGQFLELNEFVQFE